jgi:hypothetical protein
VIVAEPRGDRRPLRRGEVTHSVTARVEDARAHCESARAQGARILMEPTDFEYGERQHNTEDPGGHQWTFSKTRADVAPEEFRPLVPRREAWLISSMNTMVGANASSTGTSTSG